MTRLLALDPGTTNSGYALLDGAELVASDWKSNAQVRHVVRTVHQARQADRIVIEDVSNYGKAVGRDVFDTLKWAGRFAESARVFLDRETPVTWIERPAVKVALCGDRKAKDTNVRQAVIDRFGGDRLALGAIKCDPCKGRRLVGLGKKRGPCQRCDGTGWEVPPGPLKGVGQHEIAAIALALAWLEGVR